MTTPSPTCYPDERGAGRGVDFDAVGRTLLLALALYLLAALFVWVQARLLNVIVQRTVRALRADVEAKVHRLPLSYFDSRQRGELLSRVTNDVDNIQSSVSMTISQLLTSVLTVVAALAMMLTISPLLTLITVITVPLSLWVTRAIARRSQKMFIAQWTNTGRLNAHIEETYSGFTVVKTFGHRAAAQERFRDCNDDVYDASFGAQFFSGLVARPPPSSATSAMWPSPSSAATRWPPGRSRWAASRRSSSTCASSTSR